MLKRKRNLTTSALLDFESDGSSSDSDFDIEAERNATSSSESNSDTDDNADTASDSDEISDQVVVQANSEQRQLRSAAAASSEIEQQKQTPVAAAAADVCTSVLPEKKVLPLICGVCLDDDCAMDNGMLECDNCGVSVHEFCYGDVANSCVLNSTPEYWFCEACCAGVTAPVCELCPHRGGLYKETDAGLWVHLVCALYVPYVKFHDIDKLSSVTLMEMPHAKWGERKCMLCQDTDYARTGVCVGCDAGLCKSYFHVTCAQAAGLLVEGREEDADSADPLYAQCCLHTERELIKKRKRNYQLWCYHVQTHQKPEDLAVERKLQQCRKQFDELRRSQPTYMPTKVAPRALMSSTTALPRMQAKAQVFGIDMTELAGQAERDPVKAPAAKKLHMAPSFNEDFIHFFRKRNERMQKLKQEISDLQEKKANITNQLTHLNEEYVRTEQQVEMMWQTQCTLHETISMWHKCIGALHPAHTLPTIEYIASAICTTGKSDNTVEQLNDTSPHGSPEAASQSHTAGLRNCTKCQRYGDQQLLVKCDVCKRCYHLTCLQPPLAQLPLRSRSSGWQCAKCNKYAKVDGPGADERNVQK